MKSSLSLIIGLVGGALVTVIIYTIGFTPASSNHSSTSSAEKPLYWVAPMDPNYQSDKPGKSPMGMDLVPVYASDGNTNDGAGIVLIQPAVENNLGVRTSQVKRQALNIPISTVGYVQYDQDTLVHVHPRVEGWVDKLFVKAAGEYVEKGQPLYALYAPQLVNAQQEFLLASKRANRELIVAAQSRLEALQMPKAAIAQLKASGQVQQTVVFNALQSGFVDNLDIREGFYVKPGTTLLSVGALDKVWVDAQIYERQSSLVKVGQPVTMRLDYLPQREWQGVVDYVYPTLQQETRTLKVRLRFDNQDYSLKPNMFAQVTIHASLPAKTLVVPSEAVIRTGKQNRLVLAMGEGRYKSIQVDIGHIANDVTQILTGLNAGDEVVTSAQFLLDSESSIDSDFKRMQDRVSQVDSVWTQAVINHVKPQLRMVNLDHEPIPQWQWPSMTMDFALSDKVDISLLAQGMTLRAQLAQLPSGSYQITAVQLPSSDISADEQDAVDRARVKGVINRIDKSQRLANISRQGIAKWQRGPATLDFLIARQVDIHRLREQEEIDFTFVIQNGEFVVVDVHNDDTSKELMPGKEKEGER